MRGKTSASTRSLTILIVVAVIWPGLASGLETFTVANPGFEEQDISDNTTVDGAPTSWTAASDSTIGTNLGVYDPVAGEFIGADAGGNFSYLTISGSEIFGEENRFGRISQTIGGSSVAAGQIYSVSGKYFSRSPSRLRTPQRLLEPVVGFDFGTLGRVGVQLPSASEVEVETFSVDFDLGALLSAAEGLPLTLFFQVVDPFGSDPVPLDYAAQVLVDDFVVTSRESAVVPLPAGVFLLGLGIGALGLFRGRRLKD